MAYTGTIVTAAEMQFMAGELVDDTGDVEANHNYLAGYAEAYLSVLVKYDIVTNWASLPAKYKSILTEWAARFAGVQLILYNPAGYSDLIEAEDIVTYHIYRMQQIEDSLKQIDFQDFMGV